MEYTQEQLSSYMRRATKAAYKGIKRQDGGPFGAIIVKDGKVISEGWNHVVSRKDPTCHGEIDAIRKACSALNTFDLSGCTLFTTSRCCLMCLTACRWANIDKIYYACEIEDAEMIGFRDDIFDKSIGVNRDGIKGYEIQLDRDEGLKLFEHYKSISHTLY